MTRLPAGTWRWVGLYALVGGGLLIVAASGLSLLLPPAAARAVWVAAGLAYVVQVPAFLALMWSRGGGSKVLGMWVAGTGARLAVVLVAVLWLAGRPGLPTGALMLSLVGFLFLLLILEALFFGMGTRSG